MENLLAIAIAAKLKKQADKAKKTLDAGVYDIDEVITLHVKGTVKRSEDTTRTPTADIPLLATMALFMEKSGITGPHAMNMLVEAMTEALDANKEGTEKNDVITRNIKNIESAETQVRAAMDKLPEQPKCGPTNVKLSIKQATFQEAA